MERVKSVAIAKKSRPQQAMLWQSFLVFAFLLLLAEAAGAEPWRWIRAELSRNGKYIAFTNSVITLGDSYGAALTNYEVFSPGPFTTSEAARPLTSADILSDRLTVPTNSNLPAAVAEPIYRVDRWNAWHGLPSNRVRALEQTRDGYLWVGTQKGLARFDGVRFTVFDKKTTPEMTGQFISSLCEGQDGSCA